MIKINKLEIENIKRVKAVKIEPSADGLTVVGGKNQQGKTSVLDAIAWGLGGNKYRPSQATREGSASQPYLSITLSNGLKVERKGKNSDLKVLDPDGQMAGQQLLNSFVEELALNLPKFMNASNKEKADILLQIIGVGDTLAELEREENELYNQRRSIGQIANQKDKFAKEQPYYPDAPKEPVSANELIQRQQAILAQNGENQRKRQRVQQIEDETKRQEQEVQRLRALLQEAEEKHSQLQSDLATAQQDAVDLHDQSTEELEKSIQEVDEINRKVRANLDRDKAEEDANHHRAEYEKLTGQIENKRQEKSDLLNNAELPLAGLSVDDGELIYNGQRWDNMSGSEQLKVSTAIIRKMKPDCGFILIDKLEQMDPDTLAEFGEWVQKEGLQAIATRVGSGEDSSIVIEDGYAAMKEEPQESEQPPQQPTWKAGEF